MDQGVGPRPYDEADRSSSVEVVGEAVRLMTVGVGFPGAEIAHRRPEKANMHRTAKNLKEYKSVSLFMRTSKLEAAADHVAEGDMEPAHLPLRCKEESVRPGRFRKMTRNSDV